MCHLALHLLLLTWRMGNHPGALNQGALHGSTGTQGPPNHPPTAPAVPGTRLQPQAAKVQSVLSDSLGSFQKVCVTFKNTRLLGDLNTKTLLWLCLTFSEIQDFLYDLWGQSLGFFLPEVQFKMGTTLPSLAAPYATTQTGSALTQLLKSLTHVNKHSITCLRHIQN